MAAPTNDSTLHRYKCTNKRYVEDLGNGVTLELMLIPAGKFMMGAPEDETDSRDIERPQHRVELPKFLMGRYPITQVQYREVMGTYPAAQYGAEFVASAKPVIGMSWQDAIDFCDRLSERTCKNYRLPSEAEWEYACRAGTTAAYHFGPQLTPDLANFGRQANETTPVGVYPPNGWGLYDMHGNVWEYCQDCWHNNYAGAPNDGSAWIEGTSTDRVARGGSWYFYPKNCRSAFRYSNNPKYRLRTIGFRIVCSPPGT